MSEGKPICRRCGLPLPFVSAARCSTCDPHFEHDESGRPEAQPTFGTIHDLVAAEIRARSVNGKISRQAAKAAVLDVAMRYMGPPNVEVRHVDSRTVSVTVDLGGLLQEFTPDGVTWDDREPEEE